MVFKCRVCDFRRETLLPYNITNMLATQDMPTEDFMLWLQRMIMETGTSGFNAVKIHMGRMHKDFVYYGIWPTMFYSESEKEVMDLIAHKFGEHNKVTY